MLSKLLGRLRNSEPESPPFRAAEVYRRGGKVYVSSSSQTRDGFWMLEGHAVVVDVDDAARLYNAVHAALAGSRSGVRAPADWSSWCNPVLEAAGYKRFSAFAKGTSLVGIKQEAGRIQLLPHHNGGSSDRFVGLADQAMETDSDSSELPR